MKQTARVLLVEDQAADAELVQMILRDCGHASIATTGDGAEALDYLYRRGVYADRVAPEPALVLLDLKMPRVNGWEVLADLKQHPGLKLIPVVVLTSSRDDADVVRAYELGANAYLVKEIDFDRYAEMLDTCTRFWLGCNEPPPASAGLSRHG